MSDRSTVLQKIQDAIISQYADFVQQQDAQMRKTHQDTDKLAKDYEDQRQKFHDLFRGHGFEIDIAHTHAAPPSPSETPRAQVHRSATVKGFSGVWKKLIEVFVRSYASPERNYLQQRRAQLAESQANTSRQLERFQRISSDEDFFASLRAMFASDITPSTLLWQIMRQDAALTDLPAGEHDIHIPHQALIQWYLQQEQDSLSPFAYLLAWYMPKANKPIADMGVYTEVINYIFACKPTVHQSKSVLPSDQYTVHYTADDWQPIELPDTTGTITQGEYTIAYRFLPNEHSQERGEASEDALFFTIKGSDFFVSVCDGVSQSCMGGIAARSVTTMLHNMWQELKQPSGQHASEDLPQKVKQALYAAKFHTNQQVASRLNSEEFKQSTSQRIWRILESLYREGGSQSTFSCVFRIADCLYAISMGNSGILIQEQGQKPLLHPDNPQFSNDGVRFSSGERDGIRGEPSISVFPDFCGQSTPWRVVIHSDALAEYENRGALYDQPFTPPSNGPLNVDDTLLQTCVKIDDTTIVELFCDTKK